MLTIARRVSRKDAGTRKGVLRAQLHPLEAVL